MGLIIDILIGALVGWCASRFMNMSGAWYIYVLLGLAGSIVGNLLFGLFGISASSFSIGSFVISLIGACLVIWVYRKFAK